MKSKSSVKAKRRVFLVDDHAVVREGLKWIIERENGLEICGEAGSAAETLEKIGMAKPDLVLIDIALPGLSGLDLCKSLRAGFPEVRILILSMFKESLYAERALRAGANGYIMKRDGGQNLLAAIHHVLGGHTYVSEEVNEIYLKRLAGAGQKTSFSMDTLSNRELDVLRLIGQGYGSKEIAASLGISIKTVETHRENLRAKLDINTNSELVRHAIHWVHSEDVPH